MTALLSPQTAWRNTQCNCCACQIPLPPLNAGDCWVIAEFAIVDEAYPYVAQRLLCDDSPRLQEALRYMVRTHSGLACIALSF